MWRCYRPRPRQPLALGSTLIVPIAAAALLAQYRDPTYLSQTIAGALLGSSIIVLAMATAYESSHITTVVDRAEAAAGHPYCIEIDTMSSGYRPAVSRLDLSPLMMRGRCSQGWCSSRHASLAIGGVGGAD